MYTIQAYKFSNNGLDLAKELSLDNKFKADKAAIGLSYKNDAVFIQNEDGSIILFTNNLDFCERWMHWVIEKYNEHALTKV